LSISQRYLCVLCGVRAHIYDAQLLDDGVGIVTSTPSVISRAGSPAAERGETLFGETRERFKSIQ
jgi:hypothetical protein